MWRYIHSFWNSTTVRHVDKSGDRVTGDRRSGMRSAETWILHVPRSRSTYTAIDHLLSQASGTACLLLYEIRHCPVKASRDCYRLICLDDDRGASAFELAPEKCTYLLTYLGHTDRQNLNLITLYKT